MARAFGIVTSSGTHIKVEGLQQYRPIGAFSFLGRYRVIDFPISNMSNSGIDRIQVYVRTKPRSLAEHLGTGRHYNINSKRASCSLCSLRTVPKMMYTIQISHHFMKILNSLKECMSHM